jgi:hypothetical protein
MWDIKSVKIQNINMEILENISIALVMGIISYYIWSRKDDKGNIKRGDEWD